MWKPRTVVATFPTNLSSDHPVLVLKPDRQIVPTDPMGFSSARSLPLIWAIQIAICPSVTANLSCQLDTSVKREAQLKNFLDQTGQWA